MANAETGRTPRCPTYSTAATEAGDTVQRHSRDELLGMRIVAEREGGLSLRPSADGLTATAYRLRKVDGHVMQHSEDAHRMVRQIDDGTR